MAGALRVISVQRGHDPREFALVAFGGAGPLHANAVAELMGSFPVIVPPSPGLLCALGDLVAGLPQRVRADADPADRRRRPTTSCRAILDELEARAREWMAAQGIAAARPERRVRRRHALPRPGLRDPGAVGARASRSASTRCTSSSTASGCPTRHRRSSTCARSGRATGPSRSCPRPSPSRACSRAGTYARDDAAPGRADRRPVDHHRVRLDNASFSRATPPRSTATSTS